jgi:hypothetical protein
MGRPQQKPQPEPQSAQPGLKVVENTAGEKTAAPEQPAAAAPDDEAGLRAREAEAATRRRLHPARVWPD